MHGIALNMQTAATTCSGPPATALLTFVRNTARGPHIAVAFMMIIKSTQFQQALLCVHDIAAASGRCLSLSWHC
jgi:hypothetical protein